MNLAFFLANKQHLKFLTVFAFLNLHLKNIYEAPKHHDLIYSVFMKLCHSLSWKFCQVGNLKTWHFNLNWWLQEILREVISPKKPFMDFFLFLRGIFYKIYVKFARRDDKKVLCLPYKRLKTPWRTTKYLLEGNI